MRLAVRVRSAERESAAAYELNLPFSLIELSIQTNYIQLQHHNVDVALKLTLTNNPDFNLFRIHENAKQVYVFYFAFSLTFCVCSSFSPVPRCLPRHSRSSLLVPYLLVRHCKHFSPVSLSGPKNGTKGGWEAKEFMHCISSRIVDNTNRMRSANTSTFHSLQSQPIERSEKEVDAPARRCINSDSVPLLLQTFSK